MCSKGAGHMRSDVDFFFLKFVNGHVVIPKHCVTSETNLSKSKDVVLKYLYLRKKFRVYDIRYT